MIKKDATLFGFYCNELGQELKSELLTSNFSPQDLEVRIQYSLSLLIQHELLDERLSENDCIPDRCACEKVAREPDAMTVDFVVSFFGDGESRYWYCPLRLTVEIKCDHYRVYYRLANRENSKLVRHHEKESVYELFDGETTQWFFERHFAV